MAEENKSITKIGLALSGGGYRAAAFHLGTLRKLDEMKILDNVSVISTVSGGSIVGADYALSLLQKDSSYPAFEKAFILKLKKSVIEKVLTSTTFLIIVFITLVWLGGITWFQFSKYPWVSWVLLIGGLFFLIKNQFTIFPVSIIIEGIYDRIFFNKKHLSDLPSKPLMAINSTNLATGRQFTFSNARMGDSTYTMRNPPILFKPDQFPISRAVMASSCVPFAFTPVPIGVEYFENFKDAQKVRPELVDGGVFDNQGMHKLTQNKSDYRCDIVITSDAGNKMSSESVFKNAITLLIRTMDLFMVRIKNFQISDNLYQPGSTKKRNIAYISLGWDLDQCIPGFVENLRGGHIQQQLIDAHKIPQNDMNPFNAPRIKAYLERQVDYDNIIKQQQSRKDLDIARNVGTNLTSLSDIEINSLINQAELMTELQVKLYCPGIGTTANSSKI